MLATEECLSFGEKPITVLTNRDKIQAANLGESINFPSLLKELHQHFLVAGLRQTLLP